MKFLIENDNITCIERTIVRAKSINWYDIELTFTDEWEELTKKIVYINENGDVLENAILDNKTTIPNIENGIYNIGVVGFKMENEQFIKRVSTNLITLNLTQSAAEFNGEEPSEEIIRTFEKYLQEISQKAEEISTYLVQIESDKEIIEADKEEMIQVKEDTKGYSELAQEYVSAVTFSTFEVDLDETGKLYIVNSEKLGNAGFSINEKGELEVING